MSTPLEDFQRLIALQSTTAQHEQQYDGNRADKFVQLLAHWITTNKRLPATAEVTRPSPNTVVMTVTMDTPHPLPAAPHSG